MARHVPPTAVFLDLAPTPQLVPLECSVSTAMVVWNVGPALTAGLTRPAIRATSVSERLLAITIQTATMASLAQ